MGCSNLRSRVDHDQHRAPATAAAAFRRIDAFLAHLGNSNQFQDVVARKPSRSGNQEFARRHFERRERISGDIFARNGRLELARFCSPALAGGNGRIPVKRRPKENDVHLRGAVMPNRRHPQNLDGQLIRSLQQMRFVAPLKTRRRHNCEIGGARPAIRMLSDIVATRAQNRAVVPNGELISVMRLSHKTTIRLARPM